MYRRRCLLLLLTFGLLPAGAESLPEGTQFTPGPVNALRVGTAVAVYGGEGSAKYVLLTHARRDVSAAGAAMAARGAAAIVPAKERALFEHPEQFWERFETARFHDYAQASTKVPVRPLTVSRAVQGGETLDLDGVKVEVTDTPGYTPGAVSYLVEWKGKRIACTGDLIYGDGQLFDLYSLQDAIPAAKARGYHGYAARAGDLIESLRKIAQWKPDVIVPARGPMIEDPARAIDKLTTQLQALMRSHFTTDALRWYWGDENLAIRSRKALAGKPVEWMPMAEQAKLPEWVLAIGNSRLILSTSGAAFLVDAGYGKIIPELEKLQKEGRFKTLEGVWITHYHDDHTDNAQAVSDKFRCPVYFTDRMGDVLARPAAYRLPCLTTNPIRGNASNASKADGSSMKWHEFRFRFDYFPGQTLYHGGLLAERESGESLYFVGDSFTPSGMDDYCLQNRNVLRPGEGFLYCLNIVSALKKDTWLINQHVAPTFRFTERQLATMKDEIGRRMDLLQNLSPWPDWNYAVDESWARMTPYGSELKPGERLTVELHILNHSPRNETYRVQWHAPSGLRLVQSQGTADLKARQEGVLKAVFEARSPGLHLVTADVSFAGRTLPEWTEAMVRVR